MSQLRFGLIGFGSIGVVRAEALARSSDCCLTAVYDSNPERRARLPQGVRAFESAEALMRSADCDAVIISTPPDSHAELALCAMMNGKHVVVEKPIANTLLSSEQMLRMAEKTGCTLTVGFNHRYFKGVKRLRSAISGGEIGTLRYVKAYAGHVGLPELRSPWMYDPNVMGGGTLMDNGIHIIDLVRHVMGDIDEVSALMSAPIWNVGVEENAFVELVGSTGVIGSIHSSWTAWQGYKFKIEAYGSDGMAMMSYAPMYSSVIHVTRRGRLHRSIERNFYLSDIIREKARGWQRTVIDTFLEEFRDFRSLVDNADVTTTIATGYDGANAIAIADAAYRSATERRRVLPAKYSHG